MKPNFYQKIYNELVDFLPANWRKVALYIYYSTESSYEMKFYIYDGNKYISCFDYVDKIRLADLFSDIDDIIYPVRKELRPKDKWTVMTYIFDCNGKFKVDYVYDEIESIQYFQEWKNRYLK